MLEGKRQKQVAGLLNKELSDIFQRLGLSMMDGGMVSISSVKITPDLFDARIYQAQHRRKAETDLEKRRYLHQELRSSADQRADRHPDHRPLRCRVGQGIFVARIEPAAAA